MCKRATRIPSRWNADRVSDNSLGRWNDVWKARRANACYLKVQGGQALQDNTSGRCSMLATKLPTSACSGS